MREPDFVYLLYLPMTLVLYAAFAARDIPVLTGRRVSPALEEVAKRALRARGPVSNGLRIARLFGWTAFTQVVPLLFALSDSSTPIRVVSAAEMLGAIAWTAYLLRLPSSDVRRT